MGACCCCKQDPPLAQQEEHADSSCDTDLHSDEQQLPDGRQAADSSDTQLAHAIEHLQAEELAAHFGVNAEFALAVLRDHPGEYQTTDAWIHLLRYIVAIKERGEAGIAESQNYMERQRRAERGEGVVIDGRCTGVIDCDDHGVLVRSHSGYLADELNHKLADRGLLPVCSRLRARNLISQFAPTISNDEPNSQLEEAHKSIGDMMDILQCEQVDPKVFGSAIKERGEAGIAESQNYAERQRSAERGDGVVIDGRCTGVIDCDDHGVLVRSHSGFIADEVSCSIEQARAFIDKYAGPSISRDEPNRQLEEAYRSIENIRAEVHAATPASREQTLQTIRAVIFGGSKPASLDVLADKVHERYQASRCVAVQSAISTQSWLWLTGTTCR